MTKMLTTIEVAELLGCSQHAINQRCYRGEIPYVKLSAKTRRFRQSDIEEILENGFHPTIKGGVLHE